MMKASFLTGVALSLATLLIGQEGTTTYGAQSPIIVATKSALNYHNEVSVDAPIPEDLVPLLAGLLITNKVDHKKSDEAIAAWITRYNQLNEAISQVSDEVRAQRARRALEQGDFLKVESLLSIFPDNPEVRSFFPNAFGSAVSTQGNQSPVVYAEVAEITYVMRKVIHYHLPEQLSVELLRELQFTRSANQELEGLVKVRDETIAKWVQKYREVEVLLKNSPDSVTLKAQEYFSLGQLDSSLMVLKVLDGTKVQVAKGCYLQAKIMMLRFSHARFDALTAEIGKLLRQSVTLHEEVNVMLSYGIFLAESANDFYNANLILTRAKKITQDTLLLLQIESELGFVQGALQNTGAMEAHALETLRLCDAYADPTDTLLLGVKNQAYGFLANVYFQRGVNSQNNSRDSAGIKAAQEKIQLAIHYDSLCLAIQDTLNLRLKTPSSWRLPNRFIVLSNLASRIPLVKSFTEAEDTYKKVLEFMSEEYKENPLALSWHYAQTLLKYGGFLFTAGYPDRAVQAYQEAEKLTVYFQPDQNISSYNGLRMVYSHLVGTLMFTLQPDQVLTETNRLILRLDAYIENGIDYGSNLKAELQQFAAYSAFRAGEYQRGIAYTQGALVLWEEQPAPSAQYVQGYVSNLTLLAWFGVMNAVGLEDYNTANWILDKASALMERANGVHLQTQSQVKGSQCSLDLFRVSVALRKEDWFEAAGLLDEASTEIEALFSQDPLSFQSLGYRMMMARAELFAEIGDKEGAMDLLIQANRNYYTQAPAAYRSANVNYYIQALSKLLSLGEGSKKAREDWAAELSNVLNELRNPALDIQAYNQYGSIVVDMNRLHQCESIFGLVEYYQSLPRKKRPAKEGICAALRELKRLLPPAYQDFRSKKISVQLPELMDSCGCD
ncbi:MAG: hypothetical protein RIC19_18200 [Phaeodactylibacter sp.]|uniref:hypothetical protein n=1 Tax=Phaeodactylibacter sp. TaxID=1940289 RepID=UPI0032ECBA56